MPNYRIEILTDDRIVEAAALLAEAFVTNPVHMAVFHGSGPDALRENMSLFQLILSKMPGEKEMVLRDGRVVGVARWVHSVECQPTFADALKMIPAFLFGFGSKGWRVRYWLNVWAAQDPLPLHHHLGAIGVDPAEQGNGVGTMLMESYVKYCDTHRTSGYLETDRLENVAFYEQFGFEVMDEIPVFDRPTWLMWRQLRFDSLSE